MNTTDVLAFWLTEEKPDKTRRRRSCLGCGQTQEYLTKEPAPSYVAWFKAHQDCRPDKSFDAEMPQEPGIAASTPAPLPECPQCGYVGVYLTDAGICQECEEKQRHDDSIEKIEAIEADPRIEAFITRTGSSYEEVQQMIDKGQITLRGPAVGTLVTGEKVELLAIEHDDKHVVVCDQSDDPALLAHELNARRVSSKDVLPLSLAGDPCTLETEPKPLLKKGRTEPAQRKRNSEKKAVTA